MIAKRDDGFFGRSAGIFNGVFSFFYSGRACDGSCLDAPIDSISASTKLINDCSDELLRVFKRHQDLERRFEIRGQRLLRLSKQLSEYKRNIKILG